MRITSPFKQFVNNQTLEALKRSISKSIAEATPHIQAAKENQIKILSQKFTAFNNWYMNIIGLDKVNLAQEKVNALQDQLLQIQEKRRDVGRQLAEVRQKSMELQDEIHKVKRQEDLERFLDLMKKETDVLKLEKSISKTFEDYDQTERELFTAFTDSIRDSHEKQRAQMEYTKYFGFILSITGSFLAFIYSTIKKGQLKQIIDERLQNIGDPNNKIFVAQIMDSNKKIMEEISKNKQQFRDFSKLIVNKFSQLEKNEKNNNFSVKDAKEVSSQDFFEENSFYIKAFGATVGLWLILKVLSG